MADKLIATLHIPKHDGCPTHGDYLAIARGGDDVVLHNVQTHEEIPASVSLLQRLLPQLERV
jgi:hypothetical protein